MSRPITRRRGRAAILLYHRVASPARDTWSLAVSPEAFAEQMEVLATDFRPIALSELVEGVARRQVPDRAVVVTFDDGFADNLDAGLPILERFGVPATIYVVTAYVGRDEPFWWAEAEELLTGAGDRPARLELSLGTAPVSLGTATFEQRHDALERWVQPALRASPPRDVERVLAALRAWARRPGPAAGSLDAGRAVRTDELERLDRSELIEIGAHTRHHPSLRALAPDAAGAEIADGRDDLERLLGRRPAHFSYPFGDRRRGTPRLVRRAGFASAVTADVPMAVTHRSDPYRLPRVWAVEEDAGRFKARVERSLL